MKRPETRYAWNGDVSLAYQVVGNGDVALLYLQGYRSNVDMDWEGRALSHFLRSLDARHARLSPPTGAAGAAQSGSRLVPFSTSTYSPTTSSRS